MLQNTTAFSSFSVSDIQQAKEFYGDLLGMEIESSHGSSIRAKAPGVEVMIYEKGNHEPASFTVLNFAVEDVEQAVDHFIEKGIVFEQYDMGPIKTDEKGIARNESGTIAWMKDPSDNVVAILKGM